MNEKIRPDQLISHHRVRQDYEQSPQNTIQFAYGDHRYVKFTYELTNQSNILKQKILRQVEQDFSLCQNIDLCLKSSDLMTTLYRLVKDPNEQIRKLATNCITKICASSFGRKQIISKNLIEPFHNVIHDANTQIRKSVTTGLLNFASYTEGIDSLVQSEIILVELVDKIVVQKNSQVLNNIIKILKMMMQGETATDKALQTQILKRLVNLINHQYEQVLWLLFQIRYNVCMTLANISFNENGKQDIVTNGFIYDIKPKLRDSDVHVREASCLLLCSLAQLNQGKNEILEDPQDFQTIIQLLDEPAPTALNAVQLISSLAEHPKGRQLSQKYINKIQELKSVQKIYIDAAIEVIKWKP